MILASEEEEEVERSNRSRKSAPPPPVQQASHTTEAGPAMTSYHSGDDCAINELLEGRMELEVILPDGRSVRLTVERRTPMMDLLVQATTANKISPGGHVIHIWTERGKDFIHYKPSTPIGSLDTNTIYIVPKKEIIEPPVKRMPKLANQPFEPTFRLQVHLPRNQLMVLRVSRKLTMSELKSMVCNDKSLDPNKYQLVHPHHPSRALDRATTLFQYGFAEISLMSNSSIQANLCHSTSDLIAYSSREDDRKKKGILALMSKKGCESVSSSSDEFDSPGEFVSKKDHQIITQAPKPTLKKRQAPPPPPSASSNSKPRAALAPSIPPKKKQISGTQSGAGTASSHSRHSSDSSGYHEASIFDESPEHSAPETSSGSSGVSSMDGLLHNGDETKPATSKKRKAPQPPVKQTVKEQLQSIQNPSPEITVAHVSVCHITNEQLSSAAPTLVTPLTIETKGSCIEMVESSVNQSQPVEEEASPVVVLSTSESKEISNQPTPDNKTENKPESFKDVHDDSNTTETEDDKKDSLPENADDGTITTQKSLSSSLTTIDDIQDSFDETIAEAQRLLDEEDKEKQTDKQREGGDQAESDAAEAEDKKPVTKLALATINALIEQDVTQREIASHIEAAFYTVEGSGNKTSEEDKEDDWRYPLPPSHQSPPTAILSRCSATPTPFLLAIKQRKSSGEQPKRGGDSSNVVHGQQTPSVTLTERPRSADVTKSRLNNFTIGSYGEQSNCNGQTTSLPSSLYVSEKSSQRLVKSESFSILDGDKQFDNPRKGKYGGPGVRIRSFAERNVKKAKPNDNKVYGVEGSVRGIKGQVRRRCTELLDWTSTAPSVIARSSSLLDLSNAIPEKSAFREKGVCRPVSPPKETSNLKRSLSAHSLDQKSEFLAEQERLQQEYLKLQKQFVLWQKQLLSNHAVLQEERIMPASSTLPAMPPRTLRQSQSLPNGVPESHANSDTGAFDDENSSSAGTSLVLRSLSYEPTTLPRSAINIPILDVHGANPKNGSSSLRSSTTKTHFKPPQIRPSTKSRQRLPPEVRKEDDSGSDLLSRIHEELKSSSLILPPKFPSKSSSEETPAVAKLQAIFQNGPVKQDNTDKANGPGSVSISSSDRSSDVTESASEKKGLINGFAHPSLEKKVVSNSVFSRKIETAKVEDHSSAHLRKRHSSGLQANGNECSLSKAAGINGNQNGEKVVASKTSATQPPAPLCSKASEPPATDSSPPPPPPPLPTMTSIKKSVPIPKPAEKKVVKAPAVDPREELMLEIRNFGGRRALKKTSLDPPSWTTTVYNTASASA